MKALIFVLGMIIGMFVMAGSAYAYPVSTHWNFNLNGVDAEAYNCNDDNCASVTGPFFFANTGSASSVDISYDVPRSCGSAPFYTAYYFFKPCYLPQQWYIFSTCDFTASNNVNFYKINNGRARILSMDVPSTVQAGQAMQISANIDSVQTSGVITPAYIPPARRANYYSTDVTVTLSVKSGSTTVYTDTRSLNIFQDTTQPVTFSWTPSSAGVYSVEISTDVPDCKCSSTLPQSTTRTVTVQSSQQPPVISGIPDFTVSIGQSISTIDLFSYTTDPDDPDTALTFAVTSQSNPSAISCQITGNRYVSCGTGQAAGYSDITVRATDPASLSDTDTFRITVQAPANTPPVISGLPDFTIQAGQTINQVDLYQYASDSQDPDTALTFTMDSQSNQGAISCYITGNRYLGCNAAQNAGYSDITVRVTDTGSLSGTDTFRITVQAPANTPPVISGLPDFTIQTGQTINQVDLYQYASDSQDPDTALSFTMDSQSNQGAISCYITGNRYLGCNLAQNSGYSDIIVRVTDTGGLSATDTFRITVSGQQNTPPVISGLPDFTLNMGQTITLLDLYPYASDSQDPDTALTFTIDSQSNTNVISCYITGNRYLGCNAAQMAGFSDIALRVTDTGGLSATDTLRITVQGQPPIGDHAPLITSLVITPASPQDTDTLTCTAQLSDEDGNLQRVQFRWFVDGGLDKTRTIYVSGSSSTAQDTLDSTRTAIGDQVRCEATVYDITGLQDTDMDTVAIQTQACGVDVFNLQVTDSRIMFSIRNTGNSLQSESYQVSVDGALIAQNSVSLNPGQMDIFQTSHNFDAGSFIVRAAATSQCGAIDSESIVHQVLEPGGTDRNPVIDSISITPSDPQEFDDLTCRVDVSDNDGDLDRVQFRWLVEGFAERTRTVYVSGSHDSAQDTLDTVSFSRGDDVECEATVFDHDGRSDSDRDSVTICEEEDGDCSIDILNLRSVGNHVTFEVVNNGRFGEYIDYTIYVENQVVKQYRTFLYSGERKSIEEPFYFGSTDYFVKVKVTAECGSTDWESTYHQGEGACTARYLDEFKCENNWRMQKYQNSDCTTLWINKESCPNGCYGGYCSGYVPPCQYGSCPTPGQCGVSLQRFDYQSNVIENQAASVWVEAKNTGSTSETVTLSLFVDGELKGTYPATVLPGSTSLRLFYYYPMLGTHQILVKAETNCGSTDTRTATVIVNQGQLPAPQPVPEQTSVSIYPSSMDVNLCEADFVKINVHSSRQQVFTIQVTGIPAEWVSYQSQNIVEAGDRILYIFVSPKEVGSQHMKITVKAEGENLVYTQDVAVYTAPCQQKPVSSEGITGLFEAVRSPWLWVVLIIVLAGIVIFIGTRKLEPDVEYYEPGYPAAEHKKDY